MIISFREASPQPKKVPAPKPKKKVIDSDSEQSDVFPAKANGNGVTNGKKAAVEDDDFMIVSDSDSEGETFETCRNISFACKNAGFWSIVLH